MSKQVIEQGGLAYHSTMMGGDAMKKDDTLMILFTFGIFLLALLTFIFTFVK